MLNIGPGTLQTFIKDGLIIPSVNPKGRGSTRLYNPSDLVMVRVVHLLARSGYSRGVLNALCKFLNTKGTGKTWKEILFDPHKIATDDVVLLKMRKERWEVYTTFAEDNRIDKKLIMAARPTIGAIVGDDDILLWININRIKQDVLHLMR
jgi:DNA-binding transcriptional MerR regulator